jgi:hypothetical protein
MKLVTVVGAGALGSHFVQFSRNLDVTFRLIDMDRVENKNVMSQFHGRPHVRKSKVESLKQTMNLLFGLRAHGFPVELVQNNIANLLNNQLGGLTGENALVVDCLDNAKSRTLLQDFTRDKGIPCLHGALDAAGSYGVVAWNEHFKVDAEGAKGQATCEDGEFLPFIVIVAGYLARAAQVFLTTGKKVEFVVNPAGAVRVL